VGVGVGVTGGTESQIVIKAPDAPPFPLMVRDVNGCELFIMNCPAPQLLLQVGEQSLYMLLDVITFPEIEAQHPEHKTISGELVPVFVVNVNDSVALTPFVTL
jgi:hypothetical protein